MAASKTKKKSTAKKSSAKKSGHMKNSPKQQDRMDIRRDIAIIAMALVSIMLFLSVIGVAGTVGGALGSFQKGMFGTMGYIFPFLFGFISIYLLLFVQEKGAPAVLRCSGLLVLFIILACLCALIGGNGLDTYTAGEFYSHGGEALSGGLTGGGIASALSGAVGRLGAYFVLVFVFLILFILVTGKSIINPIAAAVKASEEHKAERAETDRAYRQQRRDLQRQERDVRRDAAREEKLDAHRKRLEQLGRKARGVDIYNLKPDYTEANASAPGEAETFAGNAAVSQAAGAEDPGTGTEAAAEAAPKGPIIIGSGIRTQDELDALDRKGGLEGTYEPAWQDALSEGLLGSPAAEPAAVPQSDRPVKEEHIEVPETIFGEGPVSQGRIDIDAISSDKDSIWSDGHYRDDAGSAAFSGYSEIKRIRKPRHKIYKLPPLNLLERGSGARGADESELKSVANTLEQTLKNFGVGATVTDVSVGPTVTRYELHPDQGVKISKIVALTNDIKLSLAATDIRIEAPIPGKAAVGIEVPNRENVTVHLREILESEAFRKARNPVVFGVGKDIGGTAVVADISKMPHLLIAGATGSGKSVCINTIITSILYHATPDEVRFIMVDPKQVELKPYAGIPHLMVPIVTDTKKAAGALNWAIVEMDRRYKLFADTGVRDIIGYNEQVKSLQEEYDAEEEHDKDVERPEKLCRIVVIVDEMADLMMVSPKEVEDAICRLAQLARAAGIHLVLATQRPSVNVITGLIKANIPSRIAFSVSSGIDSRIIIDMPGAEKLLGKGDMLFFPLGYPKPVRVQGAFVSDNEVENVVSFWMNQQDEASVARQKSLDKEVSAKAAVMGGGDGGAAGSDGVDDLFAECGRFIIENDKGSIGNLERRFRIGFNRAARIMDSLADAGVVGPDEGKKPREVLMTMEEFEEYLNNMG